MMAGATSRAARVIRTSPDALYHAFVDPDALVDWLPPADMTGKIHNFDGRVHRFETKGATGG